MQQERDQLLANEVYELIDEHQLPAGRKPLKSKWVYKVKTSEDGNFTSRKSRITAKGFIEKPGVDFFEIFHPVGKGQTFRLMIASAAQDGGSLHHINIKGAFLQAVLKEEIYIELPLRTMEKKKLYVAVHEQLK